jgi:hypothetical protein
MNIFYLPSLGFLAGPSLSRSTHQSALEDFSIPNNSNNKKKKKKEKEKEKKDNSVKKKANNNNNNNNEKKNIKKEDNSKKKEKHNTKDKDKDKDKKKTKPTKKEDIPPPPPEEKKASEVSVGDDESTPPPKIAGLNCDRFGGPSEEIAAEMVYWRDIPSDARFASPYKTTTGAKDEKKYLTFEPDEGGFNNIRMSMETATALAHAMGRILVLPPEQNMYLLGNDKKKENNRFTFKKFFPFDAISEEHDAVDVITMEEFLTTEVMTGNLKDKATGTPVFPPGNKTDWEGRIHEGKEFWNWFRGVTTASLWDFSKCVVVFPEKPGNESVAEMQNVYDEMDLKMQDQKLWKKFQGNPRPVDAPAKDRLQEILSFRNEICMYNETYQNAKVMHFMGNNQSGARLLVHFYAFLFFQDWKQDLWTKRYVRDHLRYIDAIQCGAATIVDAVRNKAREHGLDGTYHSMHIRRGDFQYKQTRIDAGEIYINIADLFAENSTVFVATDERDKAFFEPLRKHYHLYFLDDFLHLLPDHFNKNYYGMLDQRIASRGKIFAGAYFSTFTGYINRMRGYHSQKEKAPKGYLDGALESYFYVPKSNKNEISTYSSLKGPLWGREFPTGWRDIDHDLESSHIVA